MSDPYGYKYLWDDGADDATHEGDCPICGFYTEWETCWECHGEGGFHDCGEDCCACLDKDEITEECGTCGGAGGYRVCPNAAHHPAKERQP